MRLRRTLLVLAAVALALAVALPAGVAPAALVTPSALSAAKKAKVKCHWVKATKKRKRHKVCVKVKAKKQAAAKPTTTTTKTPTKSPSSGSKPSSSTTNPSSSTTPSTSPAPGTSTTPTTPDAATDPGTPTTPDPTTPIAARLQATTREWSITLSRPTLPAGSTILQLVNRGEDAHDLHLRPSSGGADLLSIPSTDSGAIADTSGTLTAGTYTLYCSLPGHEAAGMKATLTVS